MKNLEFDDYITKIGNVYGRIKDATLEVELIKHKIIEIEDTISALITIQDETGSMTAVITGNRTKEMKDIIKSLQDGNKYLIRGMIKLGSEENQRELEEICNKINLNITEEYTFDKTLLIRNIKEVK